MPDRTRWPVRTFAAAALALAAALPARAATLHPWRDAAIAPKSEAGFTMMASRRGFDEKQGLKLDVTLMRGDTLMLKALIAGELDSFEGSPGSTIIAAARGAEVKILGCYWQGATHAIFANSHVASIDDIKGKRFAISSPGGFSDLLVRAFLEKHKIDEHDVSFVAIGSDQDRFNAVARGIADLAALAGEFEAVAGTSGVRMLEPAHVFAPDLPMICTVATTATIAKRRDDLVRYMAAMMSAERYALSHRNETIALAREVAGMKPDDPRPGFFFDLVRRYDAIDPTMSVPVAKLAWLEGLLLRTGHLAQPFDVAKACDPSIRDAAMKLAGK